RSLLFHARNPVGDSITRVAGDSWALHTVVEALVFTPLHAVVTGLGIVVVMFGVDARLTLLALAVVPVGVASSFLLGRRMRAAARSRREVDSRIHAHVQQTLSGIPVVKAFAQEDRQHHRFQQLAHDAIRAQT